MARQRRVAVTTRNLPRSTSDLGCDHSLPSAYRNLLEVSTLAGTASESLQGDRILAAKEFEQAIVVPSGEESFSLDAAFLGGFPAEEVEGHAADAAEVFGGMAFANAALVLGEAHIEHVVQFVLERGSKALAPGVRFRIPLANACIRPGRGAPTTPWGDMWRSTMTTARRQIRSVQGRSWRKGGRAASCVTPQACRPGHGLETRAAPRLGRSSSRVGLLRLDRFKD